MAPNNVNVKKEVEAIRKATKRICADRETAFSFLVEHGFLTPKGKLSKRYR